MFQVAVTARFGCQCGRKGVKVRLRGWGEFARRVCWLQLRHYATEFGSLKYLLSASATCSTLLNALWSVFLYNRKLQNTFRARQRNRTHVTNFTAFVRLHEFVVEQSLSWFDSKMKDKVHSRWIWGLEYAVRKQCILMFAFPLLERAYHFTRPNAIKSALKYTLHLIASFRCNNP